MDSSTPGSILRECLDKGASWASASCLTGATIRCVLEQGHVSTERINHEQMVVRADWDERPGTVSLSSICPRVLPSAIADLVLRAAFANPPRANHTLIKVPRLVVSPDSSSLSNPTLVEDWITSIVTEAERISKAFHCDLWVLSFGFERWNTEFCSTRGTFGQYGWHDGFVGGLARPKNAALHTLTPFYFQGIQPLEDLVALMTRRRFGERLECHQATENVPLPSEVRLSAYACAQLITMLAQAFVADNIVQNKSFLRADRFGSLIWSSAVSLIDDPLAPMAPRHFYFDAEGIPAQRKYLVREGRLQQALCCQADVERVGLGSPGNAYFCAPEPGTNVAPSNLLLEATGPIADASPDTSIEDFGAQTILDIASGSLIGIAYGYAHRGSGAFPVMIPLNVSLNRLLANAHPASIPEWHGNVFAPALIVSMKECLEG